MNRGLDNFYNLVESFEKLPSIGKKSALRLAYHIVYENSYSGLNLAHSIETAILKVKKCTICNCMCENEVCDICLDEHKDNFNLCIVQSAKDVFNIEESKQYHGKYFVLESLEKKQLANLEKLITKRKIKNILFAITPSLANDAFILYIEDKLESYGIIFAKIAQGVPTGVSLENVDILSIARAIDGKIKI